MYPNVGKLIWMLWAPWPPEHELLITCKKCTSAILNACSISAACAPSEEPKWLTPRVLGTSEPFQSYKEITPNFQSHGSPWLFENWNWMKLILADACCNETSLQACKTFKSQDDKVILPRHCAGSPFIGTAPPPRLGGPIATVSLRVGKVARRRHPAGRSASSKQCQKVLWNIKRLFGA